MLTVRMYPTDEDDPNYLSPQDIADRVAMALPHVIIDTEEAARRHQAHLKELRADDVPQVILDSEESSFGHTILMVLIEREDPGLKVFIKAVPDDFVIVWSEPDGERDVLKRVAGDLSDILNYEWRFKEVLY